MKLLQPFHEKLRPLRLSLKLTLQDLAQATGLCPKRLSHLELGSLAPRPEELPELASALGTTPEALIHDTDYSYSPKMARSRGLALRKSLNPSIPSAPRGDWPIGKRLEAARRLNPNLYRRLEQKLETLGQDIKVFLGNLWADSAPEPFFWMHGAADGYEVVLVDLVSLGFRHHPVVCPWSGSHLGDVPLWGLTRSYPWGSVVFFPQVTLLTGGRRQRVDVLACYAGHWVVIEVDGEGHDSQQDHWKERDLSIPVWRLTSADVQRPDLMLRVLALAAEAFPELKRGNPKRGATGTPR